MKLRPLERAAFFKGYLEKKYKGLIQSATAAFGNAATRLEAFVASGGAYVYGSYTDIDGLFREQATELDSKWQPPRPRFANDQIVGLRVAFADVAVRDRVKQAGGT